MTQPIQEPNLHRGLARSTWNENQLYRRPAPVGTCPCTEVVHLFSWEADGVGDDLVPDSTWTSIAATGVRRYAEFFEVLDPDVPAMTYDLDTGIVGLEVDAEFMVSGWVKFSEDAQANGEKRVPAIRQTTGAGSIRIINVHAFDIADGALAANRLEVNSHWLHGFGTVDIELQVWQNSGGNLTLEGAEFLVRRHEYTADGVFGT